MITLDVNQGMAREVCDLWKGTESEPAEDSTPVVVNMTVGDDNDYIMLSWIEGPNRAEVSLQLPLERLKAILDTVDGGREDRFPQKHTQIISVESRDFALRLMAHNVQEGQTVIFSFNVKD
jgi:hypothetical protein